MKFRTCEKGAIKHDQEPETIELEVGTIIAATGYDPYDPTEKKEYLYGDAKNVITGLELERYINASGPTMFVRLQPLHWHFSMMNVH